MEEQTMVEMPEIPNAMRITSPGRVIIRPNADAVIKVFHPQIGKLDAEGNQVSGFLEIADGAEVTFDIGEPQVRGSFSQMSDLTAYVTTMFERYGGQLLGAMERGLAGYLARQQLEAQQTMVAQREVPDERA